MYDDRPCIRCWHAYASQCSLRNVKRCNENVCLVFLGYLLPSPLTLLFIIRLWKFLPFQRILLSRNIYEEYLEKYGCSEYQPEISTGKFEETMDNKVIQGSAIYEQPRQNFYLLANSAWRYVFCTRCSTSLFIAILSINGVEPTWADRVIKVWEG